MLERESDEELVARAASGDQRAFRPLMARHMGRAIRLALAILGSATEADDIAQEAFLRVWNQASSFDPGLARFTTWLHRIVLNLAIDRMRRAGSEPIEQADDVASDAPSALAHVIAEQEQEIVRQALFEIPERQRAAIALFHFEGLSGREAAIAMDLSEKAFESLLIRARTALKQRVLTVTRGQQS